MSWLSERLPWLLFAGMVLTALGAVGTASVGFFAVLATLVTGGSLLTVAGLWILGTLGLVGLNVVLTVTFFRAVAKRASFPTSQRAADVSRHIESVVPPLSRLGLADRFEPSVEERRAELTERYVEGALSEGELEAELEELLGDTAGERATDVATTVERRDDERDREVGLERES